MIDLEKNEVSILQRFFPLTTGETFTYKKINGDLVDCSIQDAYIQYASSCFKTRLNKYIPKEAKLVVAGGSVADFTNT